MENDTPLESSELYVVCSPDGTQILDGGFEARKGRIWDGQGELYRRYILYLNRQVLVRREIEENARKGKVLNPEKYLVVCQEKMDFLRGMKVYKITYSDSLQMVFSYVGVAIDLMGDYDV